MEKVPGTAGFIMRRLLSARYFLAAMALFIAIVAGLQFYGGAYMAEFTGHPDEAAHFVSSLMVRDYFAQWPPVNPVPWAGQYYLHYPKVAIGQWPPGYYLLQAVWWLVFPIGRASALWLNIVMAAGVMALYYVLAHRLRPGWPILFTGVLLLFTPVVQEACAMVMADLPALLAGIVVLFLLTRLLEEPGTAQLLLVTAALAAAMAIKGTGSALVLAPVAAILFSGVWKQLRLVKVAFILAAVAVPVAALYLVQYRGSLQTMQAWAGISTRIPWCIGQMAGLTGFACLGTALAGAAVNCIPRYRPVALASASFVFSFAVVSYFMRAIREPRHWIASVPAILLLVLALYAWAEPRWPRLAPLALVVPLLGFPFTLYRQAPEGFQALAAQLRLPARMLVSSSLGWTEGPWIAVVAAGEARPQSTIVRATKLLAETDWNLRNYKLLANTTEELEKLIDETAIDIVVLHNAPEAGYGIRPHHAMLQTFLRGNLSWRPCAQARKLEAFCRVLPPHYPRKPLRIPLRGRLGYDIEER